MQKIKSIFKKLTKKQIFLGGICALLILSAVILAIVTKGTYADGTTQQVDLSTLVTQDYGISGIVKDRNGSELGRFGTEINKPTVQLSLVGADITKSDGTNGKIYNASIYIKFKEGTTGTKKFTIKLAEGLRWNDRKLEKTVNEVNVYNGVPRSDGTEIVYRYEGNDIYKTIELNNETVEYTVSENFDAVTVEDIAFTIDSRLDISEITNAITVTQIYNDNGQQQSNTASVDASVTYGEGMQITLNGSAYGRRDKKVLYGSPSIPQYYSPSRIAGFYRYNGGNSGNPIPAFYRDLEIKISAPAGSNYEGLRLVTGQAARKAQTNLMYCEKQAGTTTDYNNELREIYICKMDFRNNPYDATPYLYGSAVGIQMQWTFPELTEGDIAEIRVLEIKIIKYDGSQESNT